MQNCFLQMLAFKQNSNFIWRSNHMSKLRCVSNGFTNGVLNSYHLYINDLYFPHAYASCQNYRMSSGGLMHILL